MDWKRRSTQNSSLIEFVLYDCIDIDEDSSIKPGGV